MIWPQAIVIWPQAIVLATESDSDVDLVFKEIGIQDLSCSVVLANRNGLCSTPKMTTG